MLLIKQKRIRWLFYGALLSFIGPLGEWLLLHVVPANSNNQVVYIYIYTEVLTLVLFSSFGYFLGKYADRIEELMVVDKLTGLYNRHFMAERLSEFVSMHRRYNNYFSVILLDLDHFKEVNDTHGHVVGDQTLRSVAAIIAQEVRETDHPCRFGGEEFIVLCPHTTLEEAQNIAERIRNVVSELSENEMGHAGPQTLSAGVFHQSGDFPPTSVKEVLENTDKALYMAKEEGRNKTVCWPLAA
jgi:diguanylate cyclase (GGDEF)-like protein